MRGVSGSGKSTVAKILAGKTGVIHPTDDYFYQNGKYNFDPNQLEKNRNKNYQAFCDNTNTIHRHFERYAQAANQAGYLVAFVIMPHPTVEVAAARSIHRVPASAIQQMIDEWEN